MSHPGPPGDQNQSPFLGTSPQHVSHAGYGPVTPPMGPPVPPPAGSKRRTWFRALVFTVAIGVALLIATGTTLYATDAVNLDGSEPAKLAEGELAHSYGPQAEACQNIDYSAAEGLVAPTLGLPDETFEAATGMTGSNQTCLLRFFDEPNQEFGSLTLAAGFHKEEEQARTVYDPEQDITTGAPEEIAGDWNEATAGFDPQGTAAVNVLDGNLNLHLSMWFIDEVDKEDTIEIAVDLVEQLMDSTRGNAYDEEPDPPDVDADDQGQYEAREDLCEEVDWSDFDDFEFSASEGHDFDKFEPSETDGYGTALCNGGEYETEQMKDHAYVEFEVITHPAISMAAGEHDENVAELMENTDENTDLAGSWDAGTLGEGDAADDGDRIYFDVAVQHENLSATVVFGYDGGGSQKDAEEATVALAEQLITLH